MPLRALAAARKLLPILTLLATLLPAQIIASASLGAPSNQDNPHLAAASANAKLAIALPSAPHLLLLWNIAGLSFDRLARHNGGAIDTGLEVWLSPARRPAQSHRPLLLAEAALGRRWGTGLHGFKTVGVGAGWSLGDWVPFVEYRRRAGFHADSARDHQILIGVHFVLFG